MKKLFGICAMLALALLAGPAHAQATCSYTNLCLPLTWTQPAMAATATYSTTNGQELTGPGNAVIGKSIGSTATATSTESAAFARFLSAQNAAIAAGTPLTTWSDASSAWAFVVIPATSTAGAYTDLVTNGALNNYAVWSEWAYSGAEVASAPSAMFSLQITAPAAPQVAPATPGAPATTGVSITGTSTSPAIP